MSLIVARTGEKGAQHSITKRIFLAIAAVTLISVLDAPTASAHSASNTPDSNYVTEIVEIREALPNREKGQKVDPATVPFRIRSIEAGSRLELRWRSGPELRVPDYDGNLYLRVGPNGAFANTQSSAFYLNQDRNSRTEVPNGLNPEGEPTWKKIENSPVIRWHDHRAHWMLDQPPPQVRKDRSTRHEVQRQTIGIEQVGGKTYEVEVRVSWVPGPSPMPWLALGAVGALGLGVLAFRAGSDDRRQKIRPLIIGTTVALVVVDALHLFGIGFGVIDTFGSSLGRTLQIGFASVAAWIAAGVGLWLYRKRVDGLYLVTFAAGLIALVGGFSDLGTLSSTSVPFVFSPVVARLLIGLTIALGVGLVIAGVLLTRPSTGAAQGDDTPVTG